MTDQQQALIETARAARAAQQAKLDAADWATRRRMSGAEAKGFFAAEDQADTLGLSHSDFRAAMAEWQRQDAFRLPPSVA